MSTYYCATCKQPLVGTETKCPRCGAELTAALAAPAGGHSGIEVRHHAEIAGFQADAGVMARAGWIPISQVETTGGAGAGFGLGILLIVVAVIFFWPLAIFGVLLMILAAVNRKKELVVTYRHTAAQ